MKQFVPINPETFEQWLSSMLESALAARHRLAIVLSGHPSWAREQLEPLSANISLTKRLWVGKDLPAGYEHRNSGLAHTVLGSEYDLVVMDAWSGLDVDDLGALVGVVRAGGVFILLCPALIQWPGYSDPAIEKMHVSGDDGQAIGHRYIQRLIRIIRDSTEVVLLEEGGNFPERSITPEGSVDQNHLKVTHDQQQAVNAIVGLCQIKSGAVALIADRGRGKSSALGMAASELLETRQIRVMLTAPRFSAVAQAYEHLGTDPSGLPFVAPDELIRNPQRADLLMVDEAAALPVQVLVRLMEHYPRLVFATTVHGYEGSGRGFELRFSKLLDIHRPGWHKIMMYQPVRWAKHDPLEDFAFRALLLGVQPATAEQLAGVSAAQCQYMCIDRDTFMADEKLLQEVFGLLVMAHYRTRPFDLRYLMDAPDVEIHALTYNGHIVAVTMIAREGGFDEQTSEAIFAGIRRPRGHLLAQSLAAHCGIRRAPRYEYTRIVRIAVHPKFQGRGLGTRLLENIIHGLHRSGMVGIGTSFSADTDVLRFWLKHEFAAVHIGIRQEHTTGSHPVLMFSALNHLGQEILDEARGRYALRYPLIRPGLAASLDEDVLHLLDQAPQKQLMGVDTLHELLGFTYGYRGLELSLYALRKYLEGWPDQRLDSLLEPMQKAILRHCVIDLKPLAEFSQLHEISGKREALRMLRSGFACLIEHEASPKLLAYRDELIKLKNA